MGRRANDETALGVLLLFSRGRYLVFRGDMQSALRRFNSQLPRHNPGGSWVFYFLGLDVFQLRQFHPTARSLAESRKYIPQIAPRYLQLLGTLQVCRCTREWKSDAHATWNSLHPPILTHLFNCICIQHWFTQYFFFFYLLSYPSFFSVHVNLRGCHEINSRRSNFT